MLFASLDAPSLLAQFLEDIQRLRVIRNKHHAIVGRRFDHRQEIIQHNHFSCNEYSSSTRSFDRTSGRTGQNWIDGLHVVTGGKQRQQLGEPVGFLQTFLEDERWI